MDACSQTFDDIGQLVCPVIHPHNSHWCGMFYLLVQSGSIPLHLSGLRPSSFPFPSPSPPSSSTYDEQHRSACLSVRPSVVLLHSHVNCVWNVYSINFNSHSFANWKETLVLMKRNNWKTLIFSEIYLHTILDWTSQITKQIHCSYDDFKCTEKQISVHSFFVIGISIWFRSEAPLRLDPF